MPMLPPLVPDLAGTDPQPRRDRGSSVTASSLDAKVARVQRRYASNYNITYVHQPAKPPVLEPEVPKPPASPAAPKQPAARDAATPREPAEPPTAEATFAEWRAIEAQLHLDRDGVGEPLDAAASDDAPPRGQRPPRRVRQGMGAALRRPSRKALLGTTAVATVCMLVIGGVHSWRSQHPDLAGGKPPAGIAARHPDAVAAYPIEQPAPPRSAAAPVPAATPAPAQHAMAEILALRPALQSTAALPFLPTAVGDRHGTAEPAPAEASAPLRVPDTPAQEAEPTPLPAPAGTATVSHPTPAETVAPPAAPTVPTVSTEATPPPPRAPVPTPAVPAPKPVEVVAPPLPAPVPVVTVTAKPAPGSRAGTPPATLPKPAEAAAPAPVQADPPVPVATRPVPERAATPAAPAPKPTEAAAPPSASAVPAMPALASPPPEHNAQADGSGDTAALPLGFTAQQLTSTLALVKQMALLVRDMHEANIKARAQMASLTGTVQAKASDFEQRLRLAEARSSVAAATGTGNEPDPGNTDGAGELRPPVRAAGGPRSVRDYRIRRASYDYAQLIDLTAPPDQAVPREVVVGDRVSGVGRVTAITVRGGAWVVQTDHGVIQ